MADLQTYVPIATQTLGSAAANVTFSSIPSTYTDLILITNYGSNNNDTVCTIQFNGDTGSNYSFTTLFGNGSTAGSNRGSNQSFINISGAVGAKGGSIYNFATAQFINYANTTTYKTVISRAGNADSPPSPGTQSSVGLWRSTSAIASMVITNFSGGNFLAGSTFTLYGIKAA